MFNVEGNQYKSIVKGAGAHPEALPRGTKVEVRYLPGTPSVSRVTVADAESERFTGGELSGLWLLSALLGAATYLLYRPLRFENPNAP